MSESTAGWLLLAASVVLSAAAWGFLRHPLAIRRVFLRLLHAIYGERLPVVIWKPLEGGIAFAACAILAFVFGILKMSDDHLRRLLEEVKALV